MLPWTLGNSRLQFPWGEQKFAEEDRSSTSVVPLALSPARMDLSPKEGQEDPGNISPLDNILSSRAVPSIDFNVNPLYVLLNSNVSKEW